jgi:hypothetical protein
MSDEVYLEPIKIQDNLFLGCKKHINDQFLHANRINLIINLSGFTLDPNNYADIINISLYSDELMLDELERGRTKIANITTKLINYLNEGAVVMLVCDTGVNKSPVILGYYMLKCGMAPCNVLGAINALSKKAGTNLLTNQSFKKILHDRTGLCDCWAPVIVEYRPQKDIEDDIPRKE